MILKKTILLSAVMLSAYLFSASEAEAGPLLDWIRGRRSARTCQQQPAYNYYGAQAPATTAQNTYGLKPGQCMKTCQQTCTRTVVNYVPCTEYRTTWKRVPVTSYKPTTNTDPCTGCTVTCMRPCTTYTYQMQRVPYTTQRPVYRTETYKVPVTTITNDCATGNCNTGCDTGCDTGCGTGYQGAPVQGYVPTPAVSQSQNAPASGSSFETPSFPASEPASVAPSLSSGTQSRSLAPVGTLTTASKYEVSEQPMRRTSQRPQVSIPQNLKVEVNRSALSSPVQRDWNYSPIRLASFSQPAAAEKRVPVRSVKQSRAPRRNIREINSFWNDVK